MQKPKLLEEVRNVARLRHLSRSTERAYVNYYIRPVIFASCPLLCAVCFPVRLAAVWRLSLRLRRDVPSSGDR